MNSKLKIFIFAFIMFVVGSSSLHAEPTIDRKQELANLLEQDCGSCHGLTMAGGLGTPLRKYDLASREDTILIDTILFGIEGTPMPAWKGLLSSEDAAWIVKLLREGAFNEN